MPATPLPSALDEKLSELASQTRRMLVIRGIGWVILAAVGGFVIAVGLDTAFALSAAIRCLVLLAWLAGCGWLTWQCVLRPWHQGVSPTYLAALIERDYPGLSERLITLIELNQHSDTGNGSRGLMAVLATETDQRTRRLDFSKVAPAGSVGFAVLTSAIALLVLTPLALVPGAGDRARRFVLPWYTPPADAAFRIVVSSGDAVVRRGEPITLSAYLDPIRADVALPGSAVLVIRVPESRDRKSLPMTGADRAAFNLNLPGVADTFEYRVEAGGAVSAWHTVTVSEPVLLADGSTLTAIPPTYAEEVFKPQIHEGFTEFNVLQYGRANLDLRFTIAPAEVFLEWRPADPAQRSRIPIRLRDDRLAGTATVHIPTDGTLVLVMIGDRGIRTELPAAVRAVPDAPPRFEKVTGLTGSARDVRPDERIPIELAAQDDVRLDTLRIEYCLNGNEADIRSEPIPLPGVGTNRAEGSHSFALTGKAKEGDTLLFRIRVSDNRSVAEQKLGSQQAVFPQTGWAVLRITASAKPLIEQEVLGQRDKTRDRLADTARLVKAAADDVSTVRNANPADGVLTPDQAVRLRRAREAAADAGKILDELGTETALTPELRTLSVAIREIADGPLRFAEEAIRTGATENSRLSRDKSLTMASEKLAETLTKLTALNERNDRVAQTRLDRHILRHIADDQKTLADQSGKQDIPNDELTRKQRDLLARLNEAIARSALLKSALDSAAGEHLRELLERTRKLAQDQSDLDRAIRETEQSARLRRTEELVRRQRELSAEALRLADRTEAAARLTGTSPAARQPLEQAVERLAKGDTDRALIEQEKTARELDRLAEGLARTAAARGDLREAAQQAARWQDELRRRHSDATTSSPVSDELKKRLANEQKLIQEAVQRLRLPNASAELARLEQSARDEARTAAEALIRNPDNAGAALQRSTDALAKLAAKLPTIEDRIRQARLQLDDLRKTQESIARDADEAIRLTKQDTLGQKLDATATRQAKLAEKLRQLDLPGHEARRDATVTAADRATADLRSGLLPDVTISQQDLRRRLDRLRQALDGIASPDEVADELARLQRDIADTVANLPAQPTAEQQKPIQQLQQEVLRRLADLTAPEAATTLSRARDAVREADEETRKGDRPDELRKQTREAADVLTRLANQLSSSESETDRVERLVRERMKEIEKARQFERQPTNPELTAAARRQVQSQIDELELTRAGKAQTTKQKAIETLQKLRQSVDPTHNMSQQQEAADGLHRLAEEMTKNGDRSKPLLPEGPSTPTIADELRRMTGGGNLPTAQDATAARNLARQQRELRDATSEAAVELARGVPPSEKNELGQAAIRLQKRQGELVAEADHLREALRDAGEGSPDSPLKKAAATTTQAHEQMTQAERSTTAGRAQQAAEARRQAIATLGRAVADVSAAAESRPETAHSDQNDRKAGSAVRQAADQMHQADARLRKQDLKALGFMKQAVNSLNQATEALGRTLGAQAGPAAPKPPASAPPLPSGSPAEVIGHLDKSWGELPAEVRSKVLQELAAKYGEDYARSIKLYFESLAERK